MRSPATLKARFYGCPDSMIALFALTMIWLVWLGTLLPTPFVLDWLLAWATTLGGMRFGFDATVGRGDTART
jgi:hypothetical protein